MNKNDELQDELEFIDRYYDELFKKYSFTLVKADYSNILFSNDTFSLSFNYDSRYGVMIFGGISLTINKTNTKFNIDDLIEYIAEDSSAIESFKKRNITDHEMYSILISKYLIDILEKSDCDWEKPLLETVKKKFEW